MKEIKYLLELGLFAICIVYITSEARDRYWYKKLMDYVDANPEKTMMDFVRDASKNKD